MVRAVTISMELGRQTRDDAIIEIAKNSGVKPATLRREYDNRSQLRNETKEICLQVLDNTTH